MRIALFEPDPRTCGVSTWLSHVRAGLLTLGHQVDVVSCTLSGRPSKSWGSEPLAHPSWWGEEVTVTAKPEELQGTLELYDLTVLAEPRSLKLDAIARKNLAVPLYVDVLERLQTPWVTVLHGQEGDYESALAPFAHRLLAARRPGSKLLCHFEPVLARYRGLELVPAHLPFSTPPPPPPRETQWRGGIVGATGRFMPNKGQHLLVELLNADASQLPDDKIIQYRIGGVSSVGPGTNHTYFVWEHHRKVHDLRGERYGQARENWEGGDVLTPWPWDLWNEREQSARFVGPYEDGSDFCAELDVHVNATSQSFTHSLTEYTTLEAIAGGAIVVVPDQLLHPDYRGARLPRGFSPLGVSRCCGSEQLRDLRGTVLAAVDVAQGPWRESIVKHNQDVLAKLGDPAAFAQQLLEVA